MADYFSQISITILLDNSSRFTSKPVLPDGLFGLYNSGNILRGLGQGDSQIENIDVEVTGPTNCAGSVTVTLLRWRASRRYVGLVRKIDRVTWEQWFTRLGIDEQEDVLQTGFERVDEIMTLAREIRMLLALGTYAPGRFQW